MTNAWDAGAALLEEPVVGQGRDWGLQMPGGLLPSAPRISGMSSAQGAAFPGQQWEFPCTERSSHFLSPDGGGKTSVRLLPCSASSPSSLQPLFAFPRISHERQTRPGAAGLFKGWGTSGMLTRREKSTAGLFNRAPSSAGLGDTAGLPPERVNGGEQSNTGQRGETDRQTDRHYRFNRDDPSGRSVHTSA